MKKVYIAPKSETVRFFTESGILAGSLETDVFSDKRRSGGASLSNERAWGHSLWETPDEEE